MQALVACVYDVWLILQYGGVSMKKERQDEWTSCSEAQLDVSHPYFCLRKVSM